MCEITKLWKEILENGELRQDRTGVGTKSIFGYQLKFDLRERFPLLTAKKTLWKSAFVEMLWFLRGEDNTNYLKQHNVPIWDAWADKDGKLGPIYGVQWRHWKKTTVKSYFDDVTHEDGSKTLFDAKVLVEEIDQFKRLIDKLKNDPTDRRMMVTAWNPGDLSEMGLPPCHYGFQCYLTSSGELDLMLNIRSMDTGLGTPFNVAQYAFLQHLIARAATTKEKTITPRFLIVNCGDAHIYKDHLEEIEKLVKLDKDYPCKTELKINTNNTELDGYKIEDFDIINYECGPFIKLPIAV